MSETLVAVSWKSFCPKNATPREMQRWEELTKVNCLMKAAKMFPTIKAGNFEFKYGYDTNGSKFIDFELTRTKEMKE